MLMLLSTVYGSDSDRYITQPSCPVPAAEPGRSRGPSGPGIYINGMRQDFPRAGTEGQRPDRKGQSPCLGESQVFEEFGDCCLQPWAERRAPDPEFLLERGREGQASGSTPEIPSQFLLP